MQGVTRPENIRMADLLDIQVETITPEEFAGFDRVATVDVQPHYFHGLLPRVDLVVDHHPEQPGYTAVFKDIRSDYGLTCTILTEHLRAVDVNIQERTATAMLYAISCTSSSTTTVRPAATSASASRSMACQRSVQNHAWSAGIATTGTSSIRPSSRSINRICAFSASR